MSLFNKFCHTAHCSCKQSHHRPLKVVLEIYDFLGQVTNVAKLAPNFFPTTLHLGIYISNLCSDLTYRPETQTYHNSIKPITKATITPAFLGNLHNPNTWAMPIIRSKDHSGQALGQFEQNLVQRFSFSGSGQKSVAGAAPLKKTQKNKLTKMVKDHRHLK